MICIFILATVFTTIIFNGVEAKETNQKDIATLCKQVLVNISEEIKKLKPKFSELANFNPDGPIIPGNVIPSAKQLDNLQLTYYYNCQYIHGADDPSSVFIPQEGGCSFRMQVFPDGNSWAGFRMKPNMRIIDVFYNNTGIRVQGYIDCQNSELADTLESIIKRHIEILK